MEKAYTIERILVPQVKVATYKIINVDLTDLSLVNALKKMGLFFTNKKSAQGKANEIIKKEKARYEEV